ncbi:WD repeat domain phosphoinositide-interacting protein 4 [Bulinus truncatus]|nr:WD repeat domain phosphoinositide-interacting protein 4 [Bulinus truncatus]
MKIHPMQQDIRNGRSCQLDILPVRGMETQDLDMSWLGQDLDKEDAAPESKPPSVVQAHSNDIICAAINSAGDCIATASTQGTNIHLYNVHTKVITKLRRGLDKANIYCLNFSKDSSYLSCSSDKGTVHVWSLKDPEMNPVSTLKPLVGLPNEVKSYASFTVTAECACLCSFGAGDAMFAICMDGSFHKYKLGRDGSQTDTGRNCFRVAYDIYPNLGEMFKIFFFFQMRFPVMNTK